MNTTALCLAPIRKFLAVPGSLLVVAACAHSPPRAKPPEIAPARRTAYLYAAHRTLSPNGGAPEEQKREFLAERWRSITGFRAQLAPRGDFHAVEDALLAAAIERADFLIYVTHPAGRPNEYVAAAAYGVTEGNLLGETAVTRKGNKRIAEALADWFRRLREAAASHPPFDALKFAETLQKTERCADLDRFAARLPEAGEGERAALDRATDRCRRKAVAPPPPPAPGVVRLKMVGVPRHLQPLFERAVAGSELHTQVTEGTRRPSELTVQCAADCEQGRLQLAVPFDAVEYRALRGRQADRLWPFRRLGSALLEYRGKAADDAPALLRPAITKFEAVLRVGNVSGPDLVIRVEGLPPQPALKSDADLEAFLNSRLPPGD